MGGLGLTLIVVVILFKDQIMSVFQDDSLADDPAVQNQQIATANSVATGSSVKPPTAAPTPPAVVFREGDNVYALGSKINLRSSASDANESNLIGDAVKGDLIGTWVSTVPADAGSKSKGMWVKAFFDADLFSWEWDHNVYAYASLVSNKK